MNADSKVASFGKNSEEVIDTEYRDANVIESNDYIMDFDPYNSDIIDIITSNMCEENIKLVRDKLNIYNVGGHFKKHKDTPKSGTLVVCLPSQFTGGELTLYTKIPTTIKFDKQDVIQWCAFYGDIDHEISNVTSGHRVTVTYQIYKTSTIYKVDPQIVESLRTIIEPITNDVIAYKCRYLYSGKDPVLKNQDANICAAFQSLNFNPVLKNIVSHIDYEEKCYICERTDSFVVSYANEYDRDETFYLCNECFTKPDCASLLLAHNARFKLENFTSCYYIADDEFMDLGDEVSSIEDMMASCGKRITKDIRWINNPSIGEEKLHITADIMYGNCPSAHEKVYRSCCIFMCRNNDSQILATEIEIRDARNYDDSSDEEDEEHPEDEEDDDGEEDTDAEDEEKIILDMTPKHIGPEP